MAEEIERTERAKNIFKGMFIPLDDVIPLDFQQAEGIKPVYETTCGHYFTEWQKEIEDPKDAYTSKYRGKQFYECVIELRDEVLPKSPCAEIQKEYAKIIKKQNYRNLDNKECKKLQTELKICAKNHIGIMKIKSEEERFDEMIKEREKFYTLLKQPGITSKEHQTAFFEYVMKSQEIMKSR